MRKEEARLSSMQLWASEAASGAAGKIRVEPVESEVPGPGLYDESALDALQQELARLREQLSGLSKSAPQVEAPDQVFADQFNRIEELDAELKAKDEAIEEMKEEIVSLKDAATACEPKEDFEEYVLEKEQEPTAEVSSPKAPIVSEEVPKDTPLNGKDVPVSSPNCGNDAPDYSLGETPYPPVEKKGWWTKCPCFLTWWCLGWLLALTGYLFINGCVSVPGYYPEDDQYIESEAPAAIGVLPRPKVKKPAPKKPSKPKVDVEKENEATARMIKLQKVCEKVLGLNR